MTYLPESLIQHYKLVNQRFANVGSIIRYLSNGLFTVNPIKLDVILLHTLVYISVIRLLSNFIGIITVFTFFKNHMQRSLVFFKDYFLSRL